MTVNFFRESNKKGIVLLCGIFITMIINGLFGLYIQNESRGRTIFYMETIRQSKNVQIELQKQIQMLTNIIINKDHASAFRNYYYQFSKHSSAIQDNLFNLKMAMSDNIPLTVKIENFRAFHSRLSEKYISIMIKLENSDSKEILNQESVMNSYETQASENITEICDDIEKLANGEISEINRNYYTVTGISLSAQIIISIFILIQIILDAKKSQSEIISLTRKLNAYLPPQLVNSIIKEKICHNDITCRKHITVCFTDLQGFTQMTEDNPPEMISKILNEYLIDMTTIVHAWGGMIDKFIGDGIMITFGAFDDNNENDQAVQCVYMASAMQDHLKTLNEKWKTEGIDCRLQMRIGINSGYATVGTFGPSDRLTFTAIGSTVNIASRLENICEAGKIIISEQTKQLISGKIRCEYIQDKTVKGVAAPIRLYEAIC